jgi:hypothetical protein
MRFLIRMLLISAICGGVPFVRAQDTAKPKVPARPLTEDGTLCKNFASVRCVDAANTPGWPGSDVGAWIMAAIASLPTLTINGTAYPIGTIYLYFPGTAPVTQSTPVNIASSFVSVIGLGSSQLIMNCTVAGDCWSIREMPFSNSHGGSRFSGFQIVGNGTPDQHGIHTGDYQAGQWTDIKIDNFLGAGSSCFWVDDINGWYERNIHIDLELGIHQSASGLVQNGCTRDLQFTDHGTYGGSFGYNEWIGLRMSVSSGQCGFCLDGGFLYSNFITGNANVNAGSTLFSITRTGDAGEGNFIAFRAETSGGVNSTTRWSLPNSATTFNYTGPGLITGLNNVFFDSVAAGSAVAAVPNYAGNSGTVPASSTGTAQTWWPGTKIGINEDVSIDMNVTNAGGGIGSVNGANIAHPIVWGYAGDSSLFEVYTKSYRTPLTSANRVANLPARLGNSSSNFVLDNATQTLSNKTLTSPGLTTPTIGGGSPINKVIRMSGLALNSAFTSITAPGCQDQTLTVAGAAATGIATVSSSSTMGQNFSIGQAWVSSSNTVTVRVCAFVTGTPTKVTWNVVVIQ